MAAKQAKLEQQGLPVVDVLTKQYDRFSPSEQRVATRIMRNPREVASLNVSQLAEMCRVSDATVVRLCQHAGYSGYYELRIFLMRDLEQDGGPAPVPASDPVSYSFEKDLLHLKTLVSDDTAERLRAVAEVVLGAGTVYISAIGNTTPLASDLEFRLNSFGVRAFASQHVETQVRYLSNAREGDALIVISKSGESAGLPKIIEMAKRTGLRIVAITSAEVSPLVKAADIVVFSGRVEKIYGDLRPRVESHLAEFFLLDALVFLIDVKTRDHGCAPSGEDLEMDLAAFKM